MFSAMRERTRLRLRNRRLLWWIRRRWESLGFGLKRLIFNAKARFSARVSIIIDLATLLRNSWSSIVPGALLAIMIALASSIHISDSPVILSSLLSAVGPESVAAFDSLLAVVLTVTGLFLTLYYTNFNTVIGTLYSKYPEKVRSLLIDEPQNRAALLALTNFIAFTVFTFGSGVVLNIRLTASLALVVFGGASIVPIFAFIARRILFFFDPTYLASSAIKNLVEATSKVSADRNLASSAAMQQHMATVASVELEMLSALSRIAAEEKNFRRDSLCDLLLVVFSILPEYQRRKRSIPTTSKWYRVTLRHKDWYMASTTDLQVSLSSSIGLLPDHVQDKDWLEQSIVYMLEQCFERTVIENDWQVAYHILIAGRLLFEALGAGYQLQIASKSIQSLCKSIDQQGGASDNTLSKEYQLHRLHVITHLAWLSRAILLSFFNELRTLDLASYKERVASVNWKSDHDVYSRDFPSFTLSQMENLQFRLKTEIETEGKIESPQWYLFQLALLPIAEKLDSQLIELLNLGRRVYIDWPGNLADCGMERAAVMTTLDGLEYFNKLRSHANAIYERMEFVEKNRVLEAIACPKIDRESVETKIGKLERQLDLNLARFVPYFARDDYEQWEETPDLQGHVMTMLANSFFEGLVSKDVELCAHVFPRYLVGNIGVRQSIGEKCVGLEPPANLAYAAEPTAEVFALSGFAFLLSEYHQEPELWEACLGAWSKLLTHSGFRKQLVGDIKMMDFVGPWQMLTGRSMLRTNWKQRFSRCVAEIPVVSLNENTDHSWASVKVRNHPSLCIRALISTDMHLSLFHYDAEEIFLDVFLRNEIELDRSHAGHIPDVNESMRHQLELEERHGFTYVPIEDAGHDSRS